MSVQLIRTAAAACACLLLAAMSLGVAHAAQPAGTLTFGASTTSGDGSLTTTLSWSAPGATGCTAAGHSSWTGAKAASGTATLPAITMSGTYQLSLTCAWAADSTTIVSWTNTTTNTDGTPYTDPKLVRIRWGSTQTTMNQVTDVPLVSGKLPTSYEFTGVPAGQRYYAAYNVNNRDVESAASNVASKTSSGAVSKTETVALTINPIPGPPTNLQAD